MAKVQCDLCGAPADWTKDDEILDLSLRLLGSGLGKMCDPCNEHAVKIMEREEAEALAELEDDEE